MYEGCVTSVKCAAGSTEGFTVKVGLHQGSALSPFLFAMIMDELTGDIRKEAPWSMLFADDVVLCSENRKELEQDLERWRYALERRGMRVSRSKTEYLCLNDIDNGEVKMEGVDIKKVTEFRYLGSTVTSTAESKTEVSKRILSGWNGWRKVTGVLCDRNMDREIKGKVFRTCVRPCMLYGMETVTMTKSQEKKMEVAEMKMLRFTLGKTMRDRVRNVDIRKSLGVVRFGEKAREWRLRWFGHVRRRDDTYVGQRVLDMKPPGKRGRGRPRRRFMDSIREDMQELGLEEEEVQDLSGWRSAIRCGDP